MDSTLLYNCALEFLGTLILVLLGDGVCACMGLNKSKGQGGGWIVITLGWGLAVMAGVFVAHASGAHLNPAVSIGLAAAGLFPWENVLPYSVAQMIGGFVGAILVWIMYKDHFDATDDPDGKLGTFCTMPAIEHKSINFLSELIATFILVFCIMALGTSGNTVSFEGSTISVGGIGAFPVTCLIMALGMSLGGTTGYAMNPARDLSPRIAHAVLPLKGKRDSGWGYSWVPVLGPLAGAACAAGLYLLVY